jgi:hypothetical protein
MSLVLNGNGTIQNLVAGGLPDGSVTADDIASTLDLSGKTVTLPAGTGGKVLQVIHASDTTSQSSSPGAWNWVTLGSWGASITLSSSSNKVLVLGNIHVSSPGNQGQLQVRYSTNGGSSWTAFTGRSAGTFGANCHGFIYDNNDGSYDSRKFAINFLVSPGTTSFQVSARAAVDSGGSINYNRTSNNDGVGQDGPSNCTLMEIAG